MTSELDLSKRKCLPCEGGIDSIAKEKAEDLLKRLHKGWSLSKDNKKIYKKFKFKNHYDVLALINLIAWISHREDHHPEITYSYNTISVTYYTYAIDGLSENDFICASKIDQQIKT